MVKKIQCKNCTKTFNVDFDKAPKDEFVVACPGCQQKYKLKKPAVQTVSKVENKKVEEPKISPVALKQIPCPKCAKVLKIDLNRIAKYPAFIACGACQTKIKLNDPNLKKEIKTGKLEEVKKPTTVKIDKEAINPKNHFTYKLYYHTRKIDYVSKATLFIYLSYLVSSIAKTLSNPTISSIDPQSFLKLRADANALAMQAFSRTVNPILKENGINPRLTSWASGWFVKKLSERIVLTTLENMKVDMNLPYLKKYRQDISSENNKMLQLVNNRYTIFAISLVGNNPSACAIRLSVRSSSIPKIG
jgi:DNA-directed RNA polymerase subunit M/transcription elongation factor TFIIS